MANNPVRRKYFRNADEAQVAGQKDFYQSGIQHVGLIGGVACPVEYRGDGRNYWVYPPISSQYPLMQFMPSFCDD